MTVKFSENASYVRCAFYFGSTFRKWFNLTLASFTPIPRVDTEERVEEKQAFVLLRPKTRAKPEDMDMKKRVSLELRHRSPSEVSKPICLSCSCGVNLTGWGEEEKASTWQGVCSSQKVPKCVNAVQH